MHKQLTKPKQPAKSKAVKLLEAQTQAHEVAYRDRLADLFDSLFNFVPPDRAYRAIANTLILSIINSEKSEINDRYVKDLYMLMDAFEDASQLLKKLETETGGNND